MLKILKKLAFPNVVSFNLSDNEPILLAYMAGLPANTGRRMEDIKKTKRLNRSNRYLSKQFRRLERLSNSNVKAFDYLSLKLLRTSFTYRLYAINRVNPGGISMMFSKFSRIERSVRRLTKELATDIDYKRVWIDKKPGDYGRPLGVPTMTWRIYLRMITNIAEIYAQGRGYYSECQHGGRPERGVMTCLKAVAEQLNTYENVYEFDLKGFFDHISINSITGLFQESYLGKMFDQLLRIRPKGYKLPPKDKDVALQTIETNKKVGNFMENLGLGELNKESYKKLTKIAPAGKDVTAEEREEMRRIEKLRTERVNYRGKLPHAIEMLDNGQPVFYYKEEFMGAQSTDKYGKARFTDYGFDPLKLNYTRPRIEKVYKKAMEKDTTITEVRSITEEGRAIGRDNWKELNLPNQGVPQGTNFGPFLASLVIGRGLERIPNSLIYLDDGLVFFNTKAELAEIKAKLLRVTEEIMVEIAPEKSGVISKHDLLTKGIKFLGTRMKGSRNFFTIASETRSGVKRELPKMNTKKMIEILEAMYEAGVITPSKYKISKWALTKARINSYFESPVLDASIKGEFFGFLLSYLYSPEMDINEMKRKIREGTQKAEEVMRTSKGSISKGIFDQGLWEYEGPGGTLERVKPTIYNASTLSMDLLLETYGKGYVSLRELGLDKRNERPIASSVIAPNRNKWVTKEQIEEMRNQKVISPRQFDEWFAKPIRESMKNIKGKKGNTGKK